MARQKKSDALKAVHEVVSSTLSLPSQESVQENAPTSPELTVTDTTLQESVVSEGSLNGVLLDVDSMHNESEQQHLISTAVSTELTSKDITRLQEESQTIKEELCKLRRETELLQRKLCVISSVVAKIGKDDKQIHLYTGLPSYPVFEVCLPNFHL